MFKNALNTTKPTPKIITRPAAVTPAAADQSASVPLSIQPFPDSNDPKIDLVLNKQRIDLYFPRKPSGSVLDALKRNYFRWDPDRSVWHNKDCQGARDFLENYFNAEFPDPIAPAAVTPAAAVTPIATAAAVPQIVVKEEPPIQEPLATYRRQIDELIEYLDIGPADLQLLAIDFLHKAKIQRN